MSLICLRGVSRKYTLGGHEVMALAPLDLDIEAGEMVLFVGPSGSGKTTLLNLMAGIDSPDTGSVVVDGLDIAKLSASKLLDYRRKKVGLVFQFHHLIPNLTAWENVELVAEMVSGGGDIKGCLEAVGLAKEKHVHLDFPKLRPRIPPPAPVPAPGAPPAPVPAPQP